MLPIDKTKMTTWNPGEVSDVPKGIKEVMEQCKRRYVAFNNNATGREREVQVCRLLDMIENITKQNNGNHFSSEVYGTTELIIKRRMDDIKRILKEKMRHCLSFLFCSLF
jgi:hypothetical protein